MQPGPLDNNTRKRNVKLGLILAAVVAVLMGLALFWVNPDAASGTDSILSGMR